MITGLYFDFVPYMDKNNHTSIATHSQVNVCYHIASKVLSLMNDDVDKKFITVDKTYSTYMATSGGGAV